MSTIIDDAKASNTFLSALYSESCNALCKEQGNKKAAVNLHITTKGRFVPANEYLVCLETNDRKKFLSIGKKASYFPDSKDNGKVPVKDIMVDDYNIGTYGLVATLTLDELDRFIDTKKCEMLIEERAGATIYDILRPYNNTGMPLKARVENLLQDIENCLQPQSYPMPVFNMPSAGNQQTQPVSKNSQTYKPE